MSALNMDTLTLTMTARQYETALCHLAEQLSAACRRQGWNGFTAEQACDAACDALSNTFTNDHQTVRTWLEAAGRKLGVDVSDCLGV